MGFFIGLWVVLVLITDKIHYYWITRNVKPVYRQWFIIRGMMALIHAVLTDELVIRWSMQTMKDYWPMFLFQISSYYLIFDPVLNWMRGLSWRYQGEESGWMDKLPTWAYLTAKVLCVVVLVYSLTILF
jgi:hypothetical protein